MCECKDVGEEFKQFHFIKLELITR